MDARAHVRGRKVHPRLWLEQASRGSKARSSRAARRPRGARARRGRRRAGRPRPRSLGSARCDEVVGALEVLRRPHRRSEHRELLPPDPVESRRRVRPGRRAADDDRARAGPRRPATFARSPRRRARRRRRRRGRQSPSSTAALTSPDSWLTTASAPSSLARASFASLDDVQMTFAPRAFAIWNAAVATPPPMPQTSTHSPRCRRGPRDEHPVRRLEDQRKRRRLLEREPLVEQIDVRCGHDDELGMRAVTMLPDDGDAAGVLDARIDNDPLSGARTPGRSPRTQQPSLRRPRRGSVASVPRASPFRTHTSRWLRDAARSSTRTSSGPGSGSGASS